MEVLKSIDAVIEKYSRKTTPIRRRIYVMIGSIFVVCAFIGIFIPGWPTVSWMVPAAYLFSISDKRFFRWTMTNKWVGPKVFEYYANGKTLPIHAKNWIIVFITIMSVISIYITTIAGDPGYGQVTIAIVCVVGIWWLWKKVPTRE